MDATFWLATGLFLLVLGSSWKAVTSYNGRQLGRLERKVDLILTHLRGVNSEIKELMKAGQKIQAIKLYRSLSGVGLKEAKDYVESL